MDCLVAEGKIPDISRDLLKGFSVVVVFDLPPTNRTYFTCSTSGVSRELVQGVLDTCKNVRKLLLRGSFCADEDYIQVVDNLILEGRLLHRFNRELGLPQTSTKKVIDVIVKSVWLYSHLSGSAKQDSICSRDLG